MQAAGVVKPRDIVLGVNDNDQEGNQRLRQLLFASRSDASLSTDAIIAKLQQEERRKIFVKILDDDEIYTGFATLFRNAKRPDGEVAALERNNEVDAAGTRGVLVSYRDIVFNVDFSQHPGNQRRKEVIDSFYDRYKAAPKRSQAQRNVFLEAIAFLKSERREFYKKLTMQKHIRKYIEAESQCVKAERWLYAPLPVSNEDVIPLNVDVQMPAAGGHGGHLNEYDPHAVDYFYVDPAFMEDDFAGGNVGHLNEYDPHAVDYFYGNPAFMVDEDDFAPIIVYSGTAPMDV